MSEYMTTAQFSTQCSYIAKHAASWAADVLILPELYSEAIPAENVARFTDGMRERLDRIAQWAGRTLNTAITEKEPS